MRVPLKQTKKPVRRRDACPGHLPKLNNSSLIIPNSWMALDVNVVQLNLYLKELIHRIAKIHILVEIDALFKASEGVAKSSVGIFLISLFLLLYISC